MIVVDSREAGALEAGELVKAQGPDENLLDSGELVHIQKNADKAAKERLVAWLTIITRRIYSLVIDWRPVPNDQDLKGSTAKERISSLLS